MLEKISLGAGCFWGVEHAFKQLDGVSETKVGYQGGPGPNPTYEEVCKKETGHAEVVLVTFDNEIVSLERVLDAFFFMHDPTQLNRQGPDVGSQYRSVIFPTSSEQREKIEDYIETIAKNRYEGRLVTTIEEGEFFDAELYHQDYLDQNPGGYCHIGLDVFMKIKQGTF